MTDATRIGSPVSAYRVLTWEVSDGPQCKSQRTATDPRADLNGSAINVESDAIRLAELSEALDEWIKGGGFLPAAWKR